MSATRCRPAPWRAAASADPRRYLRRDTTSLRSAVREQASAIAYAALYTPTTPLLCGRGTRAWVLWRPLGDNDALLPQTPLSEGRWVALRAHALQRVNPACTLYPHARHSSDILHSGFVYNRIISYVSKDEFLYIFHNRARREKRSSRPVCDRRGSAHTAGTGVRYKYNNSS